MRPRAFNKSDADAGCVASLMLCGGVLIWPGSPGHQRLRAQSFQTESIVALGIRWDIMLSGIPVSTFADHALVWRRARRECPAGRRARRSMF
jgi:hypothetical protein